MRIISISARVYAVSALRRCVNADCRKDDSDSIRRRRWRSEYIASIGQKAPKYVVLCTTNLATAAAVAAAGIRAFGRMRKIMYLNLKFNLILLMLMPTNNFPFCFARKERRKKMWMKTEMSSSKLCVQRDYNNNVACHNSYPMDISDAWAPSAISERTHAFCAHILLLSAFLDAICEWFMCVENEGVMNYADDIKQERDRAKAAKEEKKRICSNRVQQIHSFWCDGRIGLTHLIIMYFESGSRGVYEGRQQARNAYAKLR